MLIPKPVKQESFENAIKCIDMINYIQFLKLKLINRILMFLALKNKIVIFKLSIKLT